MSIGHRVRRRGGSPATRSAPSVSMSAITTLRALGGEPPRGRLAEPGGAAGDERDLVLEPHRTPSPTGRRRPYPGTRNRATGRSVVLFRVLVGLDAEHERLHGQLVAGRRDEGGQLPRPSSCTYDQKSRTASAGEAASIGRSRLTSQVRRAGGGPSRSASSRPGAPGRARSPARQGQRRPPAPARRRPAGCTSPRAPPADLGLRVVRILPVSAVAAATRPSATSRGGAPASTATGSPGRGRAHPSSPVSSRVSWCTSRSASYRSAGSSTAQAPAAAASVVRSRGLGAVTVASRHAGPPARHVRAGRLPCRHASHGRPGGCRTWQPARWSSTMPVACISAYAVVGPTKRKPRFLSALASAVDSGVDRRHLGERPGRAGRRRRRERPEQRGEPVGQLQRGAGVGDRRLDLGAVADDAGVGQQPRRRRPRRSRRPCRCRSSANASPERRPLAQDGQPGQPGLERLQGQPLVERVVAAQRPAPLGVVVGGVVRGARAPGAAGQPVGADHQVSHGYTLGQPTDSPAPAVRADRRLPRPAGRSASAPG